MVANNRRILLLYYTLWNQLLIRLCNVQYRTINEQLYRILSCPFFHLRILSFCIPLSLYHTLCLSLKRMAIESSVHTQITFLGYNGNLLNRFSPFRTIHLRLGWRTSPIFPHFYPIPCVYERILSHRILIYLYCKVFDSHTLAMYADYFCMCVWTSLLADWLFCSLNLVDVRHVHRFDRSWGGFVYLFFFFWLSCEGRQCSHDVAKLQLRKNQTILYLQTTDMAMCVRTERLHVCSNLAQVWKNDEFEWAWKTPYVSLARKKSIPNKVLLLSDIFFPHCGTEVSASMIESVL